MMPHHSVAITGVAVLAGFTRVTDPFANFHNVWQGGSINPNALATALVKTNFAYTGWANAFNVIGEVKGTSPARTVRNAGLISIGIVTVLFLTVNVAYISAVPLDELKGSGQLVGGLFFEHVFGGHWASKILPVLVAFSCVGNIVSEFFDLPVPLFSHVSSSFAQQIAVVGVVLSSSCNLSSLMTCADGRSSACPARSRSPRPPSLPYFLRLHSPFRDTPRTRRAQIRAHHLGYIRASRTRCLQLRP